MITEVTGVETVQKNVRTPLESGENRQSQSSEKNQSPELC